MKGVWGQGFRYIGCRVEARVEARKGKASSWVCNGLEGIVKISHAGLW
jgi:hypothetical protein